MHETWDARNAKDKGCMRQGIHGMRGTQDAHDAGCMRCMGHKMRGTWMHGCRGSIVKIAITCMSMLLQQSACDEGTADGHRLGEAT
eukprot:1158294-Pelagomonas_calceolata.AAC.3